MEKKNGKWIRAPQVQIHYGTYASLERFGGIDLDSKVHTMGRWSIEEAMHHINYLELLAIWYVLRAFYSDCRHVHIDVQSDSVSAVTYLNKFGGMHSVLLDGLELVSR